MLLCKDYIFSATNSGNPIQNVLLYSYECTMKAKSRTVLYITPKFPPRSQNTHSVVKLSYLQEVMSSNLYKCYPNSSLNRKLYGGIHCENKILSKRKTW